MKQYDVEMVAVDDIIPYSNNQKHHTPEQVQAIANSIRQFGFRQNLVIDKDNIIVIGHGRYEAAKLLGMQEVPCMRIEDLTPEQIRALRIVDNKLNESEWDFEKLEIEIDGLIDEIDLENLGFDFSERFSIDDIEEVDSFNAEKDEREFFEKTFTFPIDKKKQIINYLKVHQNEIIDEIIKKSGE